jgi:sugar/nucleoside kinase (ribokinase family)
MNEAITRDTKLNVLETFMPKLNSEHVKSKYLFLANIDPKLQLHVMDQIRKTNIVACDTMNFWINSSLTTLQKVISKTDILFLNEGEVKLLTGKSNPIEGSADILKMGPKVMVLKRGQYGAMLFTKKTKFFVPAFPVIKVVDPTGAGDTFAGGFMGYLSANNIKITDDRGLKKAMAFGTVMASFTVEDFSIGKLKKVTLKEAKARFALLNKMMTF